jgi:hypothetical protein
MIVVMSSGISDSLTDNVALRNGSFWPWGDFASAAGIDGLKLVKKEKETY